MRLLRLSTSRPAGYRRGGLVIGQATAPTIVEEGELDVDRSFALLRDPNVSIEVERDDGLFERLPDDERAEAVKRIEEMRRAEAGSEMGGPDSSLMAPVPAPEPPVAPVAEPPATEPAPVPAPAREPAKEPAPAPTAKPATKTPSKPKPAQSPAKAKKVDAKA